MIKSPDALNTSVRQWYDAVLGNNQDETFLKSQGSTYIDVRDVAEAHTLALEKEAAGGERIIISAGSYVWQDWRKGSIPTRTTMVLTMNT